MIVSAKVGRQQLTSQLRDWPLHVDLGRNSPDAVDVSGIAALRNPVYR